MKSLKKVAEFVWFVFDISCNLILSCNVEFDCWLNYSIILIKIIIITIILQLNEIKKES